ncbi:MAG TPA: DUF6524 family protein [Xanthomonadales bacterium]|nr:DUF6524 family protein [Xanthomonadales bacterium]
MAKSGMVKPHKSFGLLDFLWRWGAAIALVFATYNPTGHSYVHWLLESIGAQELGAMHFLVGVILLAGWAAYLAATGNSLGTMGTVLGAALIGGCIWLLADIGLVRADSTNAIVWLSLFALATLLAIGMSWSHIWRRLSGQLEVDDN